MWQALKENKSELKRRMKQDQKAKEKEAKEQVLKEKQATEKKVAPNAEAENEESIDPTVNKFLLNLKI